MRQVTNEPNLSVQGVNEKNLFELDPGLLDRVMQIDGVKGVAQFAWMGVAPDGFPNYFALALVDWRGETSHPVRLEGVGMDEINTLSADQVLLNSRCAISSVWESESRWLSARSRPNSSWNP